MTLPRSSEERFFFHIVLLLCRVQPQLFFSAHVPPFQQAQKDNGTLGVDGLNANSQARYA